MSYLGRGLTCCTQTNHVRDLSDALDDVTPAASASKANAITIVLANTNDPTNRPTKPKPPPDHVIVSLTEMFLDAIQDNDLYEMNAAHEAAQHRHCFEPRIFKV